MSTPKRSHPRRVLIASANPIFREGLRKVYAAQWGKKAIVVGMPATMEETLDALTLIHSASNSLRTEGREGVVRGRINTRTRSSRQRRPRRRFIRRVRAGMLRQYPGRPATICDYQHNGLSPDHDGLWQAL